MLKKNLSGCSFTEHPYSLDGGANACECCEFNDFVAEIAKADDSEREKEIEKFAREIAEKRMASGPETPKITTGPTETTTGKTFKTFCGSEVPTNPRLYDAWEKDSGERLVYRERGGVTDWYPTPTFRGYEEPIDPQIGDTWEKGDGSLWFYKGHVHSCVSARKVIRNGHEHATENWYLPDENERIGENGRIIVSI